MEQQIFTNEVILSWLQYYAKIPRLTWSMSK